MVCITRKLAMPPNVSNMTHIRTAQPNVGELRCAQHPTNMIPAQYVRDRRVLHQRGDVD